MVSREWAMGSLEQSGVRVVGWLVEAGCLGVSEAGLAVHMLMALFFPHGNSQS